jgi:PAS domain S-box-containing protein
MKSPTIPYTKEETLYMGARCVVYRAQREGNGAYVIIKALRTEPAPADEAAHFMREYELTHNLNLPGVIGCYELVNADRRYMMVLEDFGAQSLDMLKTDGRIDLLTFLEIAYAASMALAALHERRIVHGNISPSNILFNAQSGQLKLIDLGCAIDLSDEGATSTKYRVPGDQLELSYASPEQIGRLEEKHAATNGAEPTLSAAKARKTKRATSLDLRPSSFVVGPSADLYSLGVTLYELLTGRLPFAENGTSGRHRNSPTLPHRLRGGTPERLSEIVLKLIEQEPGRRYRSAAELAADLAAVSMAELAGLGRTLRRESVRREHTMASLQGAYDQVEAQEEDLSEQQELAAMRSQIETERRRYEELFALAPDGYLVTDLRGLIKEANEAAAALLGVDPKLAHGLLLAGYVPTHDERQDFLAFLRQIGDSYSTLEWEGRLKPRDHEPIDVVVRCSAVRDGSGVATEARWLIRDVTERKRAEEAMRASEESFRMIAEKGADVTYRARLVPDVVLEYVSPSVTTLTGFTPEELYADPDLTHTMLAPEDRHIIEEALRDFDKAIGSIVLRWRRKDGGVIWTEQRNAPIYDVEGKVVGLIGTARDVTARKLAEDALRKREYVIEKISASSPHLIYIYDLNTQRTVYSNRRFTDLMGYPTGDGQGLGLDYVFSLVHPDDMPRVAAHLESLAAAQENESRSTEFRVLDARGEYRWISTRYVIFSRNPDGTVDQVLGSLEEITQRKAVENALRESEERFRTAVENMEDAFGIYSAVRDESGRIVDFKIEYLNRVAGIINRARPEDIMGHTLLEFLPADQRSVLDKYRTVVETGEPLTVESMTFVPSLDDKGSRLFLDLRAARYGDGLVATWRDVTERKRREELLLEREQFIEHIAEITPGIIYVYDLVEGRVVYVNDQVKSLTGFAPDEVISLGTDVQYVFAYEEGSPDQDMLQQRLLNAKDGEVVEFEYKVAHKDGTIRWVLTRSVMFMRDSKGAPRQVLAVAYDITERKHIEETVRQANRDLYDRVDELSALNRISQPLTTITDLSSSLPAVCRILLDVFKASVVSVSELSGLRNGEFGMRNKTEQSIPNSELHIPHSTEHTVLALVRRAHKEYQGGHDMTGRTLSLNDDPAAYRAVKEGQPVIEYKVPSSEYQVEIAGLSSLGLFDSAPSSDYPITRMILPLRARGTIIGLLTIGNDPDMWNPEAGMRNKPELNIPDSAFGIPNSTVWSPSDVRLAQTVAGMVAGAIANARLFSKELKQRLLAESLNEVATALTSSLDIDTVVHTIFEQLKRVLDYHGAALLLRDGDDLIETQSVGISARHAGYRFYSALKGPQIEVFESREARCISDTHNYRHWTPPDANKLVRSWMGAPLIIGDRTLGVLTVSHSRRKTYTAEHLRLLQSFANEAAIAINNATRYREALNVAAYEERNRLARELHDSVTQSLFSANLVAKVLPDLAQNNPERFDYAVKTLGQLTQTALAEMRTMLLELRPRSLTQAPLDSAFQNLTLTIASRSPLEITHSTFDPTPALPEDVQLGLYRIVQETLTNIVKHSQAHHVEFDLRVHPPFPQGNPRRWQGEIAIHIADDGKGFDMDAVPQGHFGLQIMRERAASIGAKFEMTSEQGNGTQMTVVWAGETAIPDERAKRPAGNE